jgi:hypothetical protein
MNSLLQLPHELVTRYLVTSLLRTRLITLIDFNCLRPTLNFHMQKGAKTQSKLLFQFQRIASVTRYLSYLSSDLVTLLIDFICLRPPLNFHILIVQKLRANS